MRVLDQVVEERPVNPGGPVQVLVPLLHMVDRMQHDWRLSGPQCAKDR